MNRISNSFNSTAVHLERYETCMLERFCESNDQLKEVTDLWQDSKDATDLHFKKFFTQFTLYQGQNPCWIEHARLRKFQNFNRKKLSSVH